MSLRIVLGVSGGIAAYKAVLLLRLLREQGHRVRVVPTDAALQFVGRATWEALSGEPVHTGVFDGAVEVEHVALGRSADLVVVAPATADLLARAAAGRADDLLTATLLTVTCPVLLVPAMHTEMWLHAATRSNVALLRARGTHLLDPDSGRLTGADSGPGRLPEPEAIVRAALDLVASDVPAPGRGGGAEDDLAGRVVVVSAGGTQEPIDPVRYLGNRSSGRQGVEVARAAAARGATVRLVAAHLEVDAPAGVEVVQVRTTAEMRAAVRDACVGADVVVMAAAVADFRPARSPDSKIKKVPGRGPAPIELVENPDILAELVTDPPDTRTLLVGFAAETGDEATVLRLGQAKARRKRADLLAVNAVGQGRGFGEVPNQVTVLDADGAVVARVAGSKAEVADGLLDVVAGALRARRGDALPAPPADAG